VWHLSVKLGLLCIFDRSESPSIHNQSYKSPNLAMAPYAPDGVTPSMHRFLRTLPHATINVPTLVARQDAPPATVTVYVNQGGTGANNGLSGGEIAGIVIGSIVGFLLLMWLVFRCTGGRTPREPPRRESYYHHEEPKYHRGSRHRSRHSHSRRRSGSIHAPPPVVIREYSRGPSRGRANSRGY
jgi:hypothetical protein